MAQSAGQVREGAGDMRGGAGYGLMMDGHSFIKPSTKGFRVKQRVWVNFKELRARLRFEDVLKYYGVEVRRQDNQHKGPCPLPNHGESKTASSFSAHLEKGIFHCFGCGAGGNVLEFAALMAKVDPKDGQALRNVAVELQTHFFPEGASSKTRREEAASAQDGAGAKDKQRVVNAPLDFELKDLDPSHPYLLGRGFTPEAISYFGLGFCTRGMLKDLLAIPLHDSKGKLVGYVGRVPDEAAAKKGAAVYRFPQTRERHGTILEFDKSLLLYNGHRVEAPCDDLIVVRDFASVWWLHQNGLPRAVALMGWDCSEVQADLIVSLVKPSGRIWMVPDGGKAGEKLARSFLDQAVTRRFVRWARLAEGQRPTDMSDEELKSTFAT